MREQVKNITEAIIAKNLDDRLIRIKKEKALEYIDKSNKHLKTLRTFHFYGSTEEEVNAQKSDAYFATWFKDVDEGDIHAMHSILDHFEPLELITNLGHNYRSKFSANSAEIILDFRPDEKIPKYLFDLKDDLLHTMPLEGEKRQQIVKSYLFSCLARMAKELILYFPLNTFKFQVNCDELGMKRSKMTINSDHLRSILEMGDHPDFISYFDTYIINKD